MDISEKITAAMMQRTVDIETGERLQEIHLRVCREIACSQCGFAMDTLRTVLITVHNTKLNEDLGRFVVCGGCWDKQREGMDEITADFITHIPTDFRDYNLNGGKGKAPRGGKKNKPRANIRLADEPKGLESVEYAKRFEGSGFTWFIHGARGFWRVSNWACGLSLGSYDTQKGGIERARSLTQEEIDIVTGSISLHGGANEPVKGGNND